MVTKATEARRERNRQLSIEDAKHRCAYCRKASPSFPWVEEDGRGFCSYDCRESAKELEIMLTRLRKERER